MPLEKTVALVRDKLYEAGLLPLQKQADVADRLLQYRLEVLLPQLMEECGIDLWLIPSYEANEDPVMWTMVPSSVRYARRLTALVLYRDPESGEMERLCWGSAMKYYRPIKEGAETLCEGLAREFERLDPQRIGINISGELGGFCAGLCASLYRDLTTELPEKYRQRLCPAGRLATRWLETMTPGELEVLKTLEDVTETIIRASFSRECITPGATAVQDVMWFMKDVISRCEMKAWFGAYVDYQRKGAAGMIYGPPPRGAKPFDPDSFIIREGDILHCDIGMRLEYISVLTDRQWMAYVLKEGETRVPAGLQELLARGNQFQDLVCEGFLPGRTGNQVFWDGIDKAKAAGLRPMLYCHGLGTYGHSAGPIIGLIDCQGDIVPRGELPVGYASTHALELQHTAPLPEWDGQEVRIYLEEDIHVTDKPRYVGTRQTAFLAI